LLRLPGLGQKTSKGQETWWVASAEGKNTRVGIRRVEALKLGRGAPGEIGVGENGVIRMNRTVMLH